MSNHTAECHECGTRRLKTNMYKFQVWDRPFDENYREIYVCIETPKAVKSGGGSLKYIDSCEELLTYSSWADFRYFTCIECERLICEQNPSNGYVIQFRILEDGYSRICLKCYEEKLLRYGVSIEALEAGTLPGMFLNDTDLRDAGFSLMLDDKKVAGKDSAKAICDYGIEEIKRGRVVIISYERMAIGGLEGYVSLWSKYPDKEEEN